MTSQVIIYNLHGVAVASDTVVTITVDGRHKTLEGTSKIYEIGDKHSILISHSGNVQINGIPHSLHIAEWAKTLDEPLDFVSDYVDSYLAWSASPNTLSAQIDEDSLALSLISERLGHLRGLAEEVDPESPTCEKEIEDFFQLIYDSTVDSVENYGDLDDDDASQLVADNYLQTCEAWINELKADFKISEQSETIAYKFCTMALSRMFASNNESTIAFVGFGKIEPTPSGIAFSTPGVYAGRLRTHGLITSDGEATPIGDNSDHTYFHATDQVTNVITLAQDSAIKGFMRGFAPDIVDYVTRVASEKLMDSMSEPQHLKLKASLELQDAIRDALSEYGHQRTSQLLSTVSAMQISALAEFADSLVGIQALSTYSDLGIATVGGLVEVATIDRKKGVTWHRSLEANRKAF
jgi:hypothetical protein